MVIGLHSSFPACSKLHCTEYGLTMTLCERAEKTTGHLGQGLGQPCPVVAVQLLCASMFDRREAASSIVTSGPLQTSPGRVLQNVESVTFFGGQGFDLQLYAPVGR